MNLTAAGMRAPYPPLGRSLAVLAMLVVATMFSYVDRTILSLLVAPIRHDMRLTDLRLSLLLGPSFAVFYAVMGVPLGWAADVGPRLRLAAAGVALWSAATVLGGLSQEFWQLFLARVGVAVGEAVLLPTSISLVADSFAPGVRTTMLGVLGMAIYWGTGLALLFGGLVIRTVGRHADADGLIEGFRQWQVVLMLVGLPGLPLALGLALLPEPGRRRDAVSRHLREDPVLIQPATPLADDRRRTRVEFGWLCGAIALMAIVGYSLASWMPSYLVRAYGWPAGRAGIDLGLGFIIATTAIILMATRLADRLSARGRIGSKYLILGCCTSLGVPLMAVLGCVHVAAVSIVAASCAMGASAACIAMGPAAVSEIFPTARRGRAVGTYQMIVGLIGGGIGAPAIALAAHGETGAHGGLGLALAKVAGAGFLLAAAIFWWRRHTFGSASLAVLRPVTAREDSGV